MLIKSNNVINYNKIKEWSEKNIKNIKNIYIIISKIVEKINKEDVISISSIQDNEILVQMIFWTSVIIANIVVIKAVKKIKEVSTQEAAKEESKEDIKEAEIGEIGEENKMSNVMDNDLDLVTTCLSCIITSSVVTYILIEREVYIPSICMKIFIYYYKYYYKAESYREDNNSKYEEREPILWREEANQ